MALTHTGIGTVSARFSEVVRGRRFPDHAHRFSQTGPAARSFHSANQAGTHELLFGLSSLICRGKNDYQYYLGGSLLSLYTRV